MKYEEVTRLGDWFAARLAEMVAREGEAFRADVIVPVPLHPDRQRERGYNQAELIARPLARRLHHETRRVFADAYEAPAGATGALAQGTLGVCTWRVRDSQRAAG